MDRSLRIPVLVAMTLLSPAAFAQEASSADIDFEPPPLPVSVGEHSTARNEDGSGTPALVSALEFGTRGALAQGQHDGQGLMGVTGSYRLMPALSLGAYADVVSSVSKCEGADCAPGLERIGARAALHLIPDFVVDPWLGASMGAVHVNDSSDPWRADFAVEVGVDLRPVNWLAFGPYISVSRALEARSDYDGFSAVGGRLTASFDLAPTAARPSLARR